MTRSLYEGAATTSPRYLHSNHQGSVVAVTDSTGNATAINSYDGAAGVAEQQWAYLLHSTKDGSNIAQLSMPGAW